MAIFRGTGGQGDSTTDTTVTTVTQKAAEAASSATSAANSATSASNSASSAETSATNAATSETNAATSATASATSATASETAKTASQAAQTAAETAQANAETAEANAVTAKNQAESARDNAQTAQTAAETAETNAETAYANTLAIFGDAQDVQDAVDSASASATTATTKASEAATSATNAANSATSAGTSETNAASSASQAATSAASANSYATDAQTAQTAAETAQAAAEAAEYNINGLYLGSLADDPTLDGNGVAVTTGDLYFNTTEQEVRVYTDGDVWEPVVDLAGDITVNSLTSNNNVVIKGNLEVQGTTITVDSATAQTIDLGDNDKIRLGDSDDLQIYHDGTDSYIANTTGTLKLSGNTDVTGNITVSGTVDGRDIATDGATLDAVASTYVNVSGDTLTGDLAFGDNVKATFGASDDLQIYHDGSHSYVRDQGVGNLILQGSGSIKLQSTAGEDMLIAYANAATELYYDNAKKLATTSSGVDVTGTLVSDGLKIDSGVFDINLNGSLDALPADNDESHIFTTSGSGSGFFAKFGALGISSRNKDTASSDIGFFTDKIQRLQVADGGYIYFYEDTGTTAKLTWDASAEELQFKYNVKAEFGDGGDLQIYHDGANSIVQDAGTGQLYLGTNGSFVGLYDFNNNKDMLRAFTGGDVIINQAGTERFRTTSTGIDVTGTVTADGLTVDGSANAITLQSPSQNVRYKITDGTVEGRLGIDGGVDVYSGSVSAHPYRLRSNDIKRVEIASNGDISFYDDAGTSQDLYWDASTSRLGLGTTTPSTSIEIQTASGTDAFYTAQTLGSTNVSGLRLNESSTSFGFDAVYNNGANSFQISRRNSSATPIETFRITRSEGDISFYDDLGTTPGFFWDASTSRLGLGTTSPDSLFHISSGGPKITITDTTYNTDATITVNDAGSLTFSADANNERTNSRIQFDVDGTEAMRIDSSGRVGIGTTSPSAPLQVHYTSATPSTSAGDAGLVLRGSSTLRTLFGSDPASPYGGWIQNTNDAGTGTFPICLNPEGGKVSIGTKTASSTFNITQGSDTSVIQRINGADETSEYLGLGVGASTAIITAGNAGAGSTALVFEVSSSGTESEAARIDSSGNLLVGTTDSTPYSTTGSVIGDGLVWTTRANAEALLVNRTGSDGTIATFRKDGSTVGSIGVDNTDNLFISGNSSHAGFMFGTANVVPYANGNATDDAMDLGWSGGRFKDLYLSGGVYLGGTGSDNLLDDYEEGTFTPTFGGSTTNPSGITYDNQEGQYTKVGRIVHIAIKLGTDAITSVGSGNLRIRGLPFNAAYGLGVGTPVAYNFNGSLTNYEMLIGTNYFDFYRSGYASTSFLATGTNSNRLWVYFSYQTA